MQKNNEKALTQQIGWRLKQRRLAMGFSQQKLADELGITFQQVQKYENGANRVSAAKLAILSEILQVSVTYFYDEDAFSKTVLPPEENHLVSSYQSLSKEDKQYLKRTVELLTK